MYYDITKHKLLAGVQFICTCFSFFSVFVVLFFKAYPLGHSKKFVLNIRQHINCATNMDILTAVNVLLYIKANMLGNGYSRFCNVVELLILPSEVRAVADK